MHLPTQCLCRCPRAGRAPSQRQHRPRSAPRCRNVVDTATLGALNGSPLTVPSALLDRRRQPVRTDITSTFDFAYDVDTHGPARLPDARGAPAQQHERLGPGFSLLDRAFDQITQAPTEQLDHRGHRRRCTSATCSPPARASRAPVARRRRSTASSRSSSFDDTPGDRRGHLQGAVGQQLRLSESRSPACRSSDAVIDIRRLRQDPRARGPSWPAGWTPPSTASSTSCSRSTPAAARYSCAPSRSRPSATRPPRKSPGGSAPRSRPTS